MSTNRMRFAALAVLSAAAAAVVVGQAVPPAPSRPANPTTKPLSQEQLEAELARRSPELRLRLSPSTQPTLSNTPTTRPAARLLPLPLATDSKTIPIPTDISKAYVKPLDKQIEIPVKLRSETAARLAELAGESAATEK